MYWQLVATSGGAKLANTTLQTCCLAAQIEGLRKDLKQARKADATETTLSTLKAAIKEKVEARTAHVSQLKRNIINDGQARPAEEGDPPTVYDAFNQAATIQAAGAPAKQVGI